MCEVGIFNIFLFLLKFFFVNELEIQKGNDTEFHRFKTRAKGDDITKM